MQMLYRHCGSADIGKDEVVCCLFTVFVGVVQKEIRRFRTTTPGLLEMRDWFIAAGCEHVAMESTGSYWKPVWSAPGQAGYL